MLAVSKNCRNFALEFKKTSPRNTEIRGVFKTSRANTRVAKWGRL